MVFKGDFIVAATLTHDIIKQLWFINVEQNNTPIR